jgi:SAM-dependent methyltransferase
VTATVGVGSFEQATGRSPEDTSGAAQRRYRAFQLELIRPHLGRSLLEVGAGLGEFADQLTGLDRHVVTDLDPLAVEALATRFADRPEVRARVLDLAAGDPDLDRDDLGGPVDSVLAINVLEHIEDDRGTLRGLSRLVRPGGTVIMWVPGYMRLYGEFDRAVGHVRRYTPSTLTASFVAAGLNPVDVRPVNLLGGLAWWATVRRAGVGTPNPRLVAAYDQLVVPLTRSLERRVVPPFGQSVLGVARVGGPSPS